MASRAHVMRTGFAFNTRNVWTINSTVREPNVASRSALERVGYVVTGRIPRNCFRNGAYHDTLTLTCFNPERAAFLYPDGLPEEYADAIGKAAKTLEKFRHHVEIL